MYKRQGGTGAHPQAADPAWLLGHTPARTAERGWARPLPDAGEGESATLRAAQLARLGPRTGDLVWDIGAGSGALAVEAAAFGAAVIAVDADPRACERVAAAARTRGVQLQVVAGRAPHVLEDLPEPDVVRVAGGGAEVVAAVAERRPERIVSHASTRDEAEAIGRALAEGGYTVECALLQSVGLDPRTWVEQDRSVVFLLAAQRPMNR